MDELETSFERAQYLQNLLISEATGGGSDDAHYQKLRMEFLSDATTKQLLPNFVRVNRDLSQYWQFIKFKFGSYAERRNYIYGEFNELLGHLEQKVRNPSEQQISATLARFNQDGVHAAWSRALQRRATDPAGAITAARTLLESVCKHILDECHIPYDKNRTDLPELYKLVAKELKLSPDQHNEPIFKQILGGCSGIVSGLGTLRNRLGDAHGKGRLPAKPSARHAEFAVNVSGSVATFLVETYRARIANEP